MDGNHIPDEDLVLFALQLLPEDRMREAKKHVDTCELCRSEIAKLQGDLAAYSMTSDIQAPSSASRERLMKQVAREPRIVPPERAPAPAPATATTIEGRAIETRAHAEAIFPARQSRTFHVEVPEDEEKPKDRRPRRAPWVLAWTGWAVAVGCSFVAGLELHQRQQIQNSVSTQRVQLNETKRQLAHAQDALATLTAPNAIQIPLHATAALKTAVPTKPGIAQSPEALVAYLAERGALVFTATHMQPAPAGKTYQLWLLLADGNPLPVGTFKPDAQGKASLMMPQLPRDIAAKTFEVTVENEGGSNTPNLPAVMSEAVPVKPRPPAPPPVQIIEGPDGTP